MAEIGTLPYAGSPALEQCVLRERAEDFTVREQLRLRPRGQGEHLWLRVQKRGLTTLQAAKSLAAVAGTNARDVGYAGLKDRHALAEQWFSVHLMSEREPDWATRLPEGLRVLEAARHPQKLRQGALAGNAFEITLRKVRGAPGELEAALARLRAEGFPNYFGEQRFGIGGANLEHARAMLAGGRRVRDRFLRGVYLSAARAHLFNEVLAERVRTGCWNRPLPGEALMLDGTRSFFVAELIDKQLNARVVHGDLHPSGPLWGKDRPPTAGEARALELRVAGTEASLCEGLAAAGATHGRRPLRALPRSLQAQWLDACTVRLAFWLQAGSYATACLRAIVRYRDAQAARAFAAVDTLERE